MLSKGKRVKNRETLGAVIRQARDARGMTQKELADAIGLEYYTMVSQMELGYITIPPALWVPLSIALRLEREPWVLRCLLDVQPEVYRAIFGTRSLTESADLLKPRKV